MLETKVAQQSADPPARQMKPGRNIQTDSDCELIEQPKKRSRGNERRDANHPRHPAMAWSGPAAPLSESGAGRGCFSGYCTVSTCNAIAEADKLKA